MSSESCLQFPSICVGCPGGMLQDGIICRPVSTCSGQADRDRDGIPDVCDNCSLTFNPDQDPSACAINKGVCPVGVVSGVLWSSTYQGTSDIKRCQLPSVGEWLVICVKIKTSNYFLPVCVSKVMLHVTVKWAGSGEKWTP